MNELEAFLDEQDAEIGRLTDDNRDLLLQLAQRDATIARQSATDVERAKAFGKMLADRDARIDQLNVTAAAQRAALDRLSAQVERLEADNDLLREQLDVDHQATLFHDLIAQARDAQQRLAAVIHDLEVSQ